MDTDNKIKLLQLRKYHTSFGFISNYEGPILTKGSIKARTLSDTVKSKFEKDAEKFRWKAPPRARIAISFRIFCGEKNPPEIYSIVKCYLDLLKGPVFKDDKQVHYLEASIWRSDGKKSNSSIFIQARKLIDLFKIWDIYEEPHENFDEHDDDVLCPYAYLIRQDLWDIADSQYKILINSKVSKYDKPGLKKHIRPTMMNRCCSLDPLIFDLGCLPNKGESKVFQKNINNHISNFGSHS